MASSGAAAIDTDSSIILPLPELQACQPQLALTLTPGRDWQRPWPWVGPLELSTVHSTLLFACWFTALGGRALIHFPSQFAHRAPWKTVPQQYICFMISWGAVEEKTSLRSLAPVPVNVRPSPSRSQAPLSAPGGWGIKGRASVSQASMWIFHFSSEARVQS